MPQIEGNTPWELSFYVCMVSTDKIMAAVTKVYATGQLESVTKGSSND